MPLNTVVELPDSDRAELARWLRAPSMPAGLALRARIVLLAAGGAQSCRCQLSRSHALNDAGRVK
jgi:hypothetical protein